MYCLSRSFSNNRKIKRQPMKKIFTLSTLLFALYANAQVGFGTPTPNINAEVDITSTDKGLLIPRIALEKIDMPAPLSAHVAGMIVYNTTSSDINDPDYNAQTAVQPGLYQNDGTKWVQLIGKDYATVKFFYMPSIVFNTSNTGQGLKRNLYAEYISQFTNKQLIVNSTTGGEVGTGTRATFKKNPSAPDVIPHLPKATDLHYYITDYDTTSLGNITIDDNGIMTYDVVGTGTPYSFVNIVFVVK